MSDVVMTNSGHDPKRGRWIPWAFVGGMAVVVAVNGILVFAAISTFPGLTVGQSYDRGRAYNQVLEEAARQDALGWTATVAPAGEALSVTIADREGLPVPGRLDGVLRRPLDGQTLPLTLTATAPGRWVATPDATPRAGQWEARLTLTGAEGRKLDIRQRMVMP